MTSDLPYVDTNTVSIAVGPGEVWNAVRNYATTIGVTERNPITKVLGTEPPSGFVIAEETPGSRLVLEGKHRFSNYRLVFGVEPRTSEPTTLLHAETYAEFPGLHGRIYRALVISSGLHVVATRGMLRSIARACRAPQPGQSET